jgi:hypothetical protein
VHVTRRSPTKDSQGTRGKLHPKWRQYAHFTPTSSSGKTDGIGNTGYHAVCPAVCIDEQVYSPRNAFDVFVSEPYVHHFSVVIKWTKKQVQDHGFHSRFANVQVQIQFPQQNLFSRATCFIGYQVA